MLCVTEIIMVNRLKVKHVLSNDFKKWKCLLHCRPIILIQVKQDLVKPILIFFKAILG